MNDITEEDFAKWKHHPVSVVVWQYLSDYSDALGKMALSQFLDGVNLNDSAQQEIRTRILTALDLSELKFDSIVSFYKKDQEETTNAS